MAELQLDELPHLAMLKVMGDPDELWDGIIEHVDPVSRYVGAANGGIWHVCYKVPDGLRIFSMWRTAEAQFKTAMDPKVQAAFAKGRVPVPKFRKFQVEFNEVSPGWDDPPSGRQRETQPWFSIARMHGETEKDWPVFAEHVLPTYLGLAQANGVLVSAAVRTPEEVTLVSVWSRPDGYALTLGDPGMRAALETVGLPGPDAAVHKCVQWEIPAALEFESPDEVGRPH